MFVVFTVVQINPGRLGDARQMLETELVPRVKQAPGFVKGTWFGDETSGHGVVVYQTRDQANQAQQPLDSIVREGVKVVASDVYELHAEA